jgi:long-chain-acyl-CoA dehydrogenase
MFRVLSLARPATSQASSLLELGTRSIFSAEHDAFRETARKFFATEVVPHHAQWERDGQISRACWEKAGSLGLLGTATSEAVGGVGADILSAAIVWEEQAYTGCTGPGFALHSDIVMPYLEHYGSAELQQKYLPAMAAGKCIGAIAMTEPGAGSDLAGIRTTATAASSGGGWVLNGSKTYITNGAMADAVIVVAKTAPEKGAKGISLFVVDAGTPGFSKGKKLSKVGMAAQDTSELFFEDVKLPASALLGQLNKGFPYLMTELPQERLLIAAMAVCSAEAAYEWTRTWVKERKAFGAPLAELQTIRHRMAHLKTELACVRAFTDQCLELHSHKKLDPAMASMVKAKATDVQGSVIDACVQLFGGAGYMKEYPIARAWLDARVQRIYGGTNEIMMELVSRNI